MRERIRNVLHQTEGLNTHPTRYTVATTQEIITELAKHGFSYDGTQVANVKKKENEGYQKHLVTMRNDAYESKEGVPTVLITNSYNKSTGIVIHTGYIRFACSNGLIVGSDIEKISVRHSSNWQDKVYDFVANYQDKVAKMDEERRLMQLRHMHPDDVRSFLERAVLTRYQPTEVMDLNELNLVRRTEDRGQDLWRTYNRIQESLVRGLFQRRTHRITDDGLEIEKWGEAKRLTDSKKIIDVNKRLYNLALEYV